MFTIKGDLIESDEGFSVEVIGRTRLLYKEGGKQLTVSSEFLVGPYLALYKASVKSWDPPHASSLISHDERERIVANIGRAFKSRGIEIEAD